METKERGILFSRSMIHAVRREIDPKTQTRRIVTVQPDEKFNHGSWYADRYNKTREWVLWGKKGTKEMNKQGPSFGRCPYGEPGDHLWIRETFATRPPQTVSTPPRMNLGMPQYQYRADTPYASAAPNYEGVRKWTPGIHMPRAASRTVLEIVDVRLHQLVLITEPDCIAEGLACLSKDGGRTYKYGIAEADGEPGRDESTIMTWQNWHQDPRIAFQRVWDDINGARGLSWTTNPWIWAITFKRVD